MMLAKKISFILLALLLASMLCIGFAYAWLKHEASQGKASLTSDATTYAYDPDIVNILFLGVDKENGRLGENANGQSDAIMMISLNTRTNDVLCLAIPRETIATIYLRSRRTGELHPRQDYLCLQHGLGETDEESGTLACKAVSQLLYDVPIARFYTLNLSGVCELTDAIGGIQLTALYDVEEAGISKGDHLTLTGENVLDYVRERDESNDETSSERLDRQQQFIAAFFQKAVEECKANPTKLLQLLDVAQHGSATNLTTSELLYLISVISEEDISEIEILTLPGSLIEQPDAYAYYECDQEATKRMILDRFCIPESQEGISPPSSGSEQA